MVLLLSTFYLFPAVLAVLARLHAPQLYMSTDSDSIVLALPSLLLPGLPGEMLAALVAAGAFAAFLSTSSGLLVSVAGALSHDFMNARRDRVPLVRGRRGRGRDHGRAADRPVLAGPARRAGPSRSPRRRSAR